MYFWSLMDRQKAKASQRIFSLARNTTADTKYYGWWWFILKCKHESPEVCLFDLILNLHPSRQFFSHVRTGLPGLNQYKAEDKVSCSRTQRSASSEALYLETCSSRQLSMRLLSTLYLQVSSASNQFGPSTWPLERHSRPEERLEKPHHHINPSYSDNLLPLHLIFPSI